MTLLAFIALYLLVSIGIGMYAAMRVSKNSGLRARGAFAAVVRDRATTFATWFGSETVLGIPSKFVEGGFATPSKIPSARACALILVGMFFAAQAVQDGAADDRRFLPAPLRHGGRDFQLDRDYDFVSRLGRGADHRAGSGVHLLSEGGISVGRAWRSALRSCCVYTLFGGMWSVALTDTFQMVIIIIGLSLIAWFAADQAGGAPGA